MAYTVQQNERSIRDAPRQIFRVLTPDEFVMLTVHDQDRHRNLRQIVRGVIGLGPLHEADIFDELSEVVGSSGKLYVIFGVSSKTPVKSRTGLERLHAARIHIACKEKHARNPARHPRREYQSCASAVAPASHGRPFQMQHVHHRQNIGRHQLIRIWPFVTRTPAMTTAVDQNGTIATPNERGNLITPVATVT